MVIASPGGDDQSTCASYVSTAGAPPGLLGRQERMRRQGRAASSPDEHKKRKSHEDNMRCRVVIACSADPPIRQRHPNELRRLDG